MMDAGVAKGSYFANRFMRLLTRCEAAQEIGTDAFCLLAIIVHQEDALAVRYSRPVKFFNSHLMKLCGFGSPKRLVAARKKAIEAGWLLYQQGGKSVQGKYVVTVPEQFRQVCDAACDDEADSVVPLRNEKGTESGTTKERKGDGKRNDKGSPYNPVPTPGPFPTELSKVSRKRAPCASKPETDQRESKLAAPVEIAADDIEPSVSRLASRLGDFDRDDCELLWILAAALELGRLSEHHVIDAVDGAAKQAKTNPLGYIRRCLKDRGHDMKQLGRAIVVQPKMTSMQAACANGNTNGNATGNEVQPVKVKRRRPPSRKAITTALRKSWRDKGKPGGVEALMERIDQECERLGVA